MVLVDRFGGNFAEAVLLLQALLLLLDLLLDLPPALVRQQLGDEGLSLRR